MFGDSYRTATVRVGAFADFLPTEWPYKVIPMEVRVRGAFVFFKSTSAPRVPSTENISMFQLLCI
jgi:hypothetical protein